MSIDIKCSITTAIISVLVYLLLVNLLSRVWPTSTGATTSVVGAEMNNTEWFKSMEIIMLVSVFLAYNINNKLFTSCSSKSV